MILAVDFGTTHCRIASFLLPPLTTGTEKVEKQTTKQVVLIPDEFGNRSMPSVVSYTTSGRLVGESACSAPMEYRGQTIYRIKQKLGVSPNENSAKIKVWNAQTRELQRTMPEEIAASLFSTLLKRARDFLQMNDDTASAAETVSSEAQKVVLTIPVEYNQGQREAIRLAATMAGFDVVALLHEPTAAALAYGFHPQVNLDNNTILVFDLGGGTLDVTLLKIVNQKEFIVLATRGNQTLGGNQFDECLFEYVFNEFYRYFDINDDTNTVGDDDGDDGEISRGFELRRRLIKSIRQAKCALSFTHQTTIELENAYDGRDFRLSLTRTQFENLAADLFMQCIEPLRLVLEDANVQKEAVDEIIIVGGASRIPKISELVSRFFNDKKVNLCLHPDEAVVVGAAIYASSLFVPPLPPPSSPVLIENPLKEEEEENNNGPIIIREVTSLSLGIKTHRDEMSVLIPRNTKLPCKRSDRFTTTCDAQAVLEINVYQGDRPSCSDNYFLGRFELAGIRPAPRGLPQIKVEFAVDTNGLLTVTATDLWCQRISRLQIIKTTERYSNRQLAEMAARLKEHQIIDDARLVWQYTFQKLETFLMSIQNRLQILHKAGGCEDLEIFLPREDETVPPPEEELEAFENHIKKTFEWLDDQQTFHPEMFDSFLQDAAKRHAEIEEAMQLVFIYK